MKCLVQYQCLACPPVGIKLDTVYEAVVNKEDAYIVVGAKEKHFNVNDFKMFFAPIKGTWEELLKKTK